MHDFTFCAACDHLTFCFNVEVVFRPGMFTCHQNGKVVCKGHESQFQRNESFRKLLGVQFELRKAERLISVATAVHVLPTVNTINFPPELICIQAYSLVWELRAKPGMAEVSPVPAAAPIVVIYLYPSVFIGRIVDPPILALQKPQHVYHD